MCCTKILHCSLQITIEEYIARPSGENLVALGSRRAQTIAKTLGVSRIEV